MQVALSLELTPMVFAPGEEPMAGFLYIVHRGLALHAGKVISAGKVRLNYTLIKKLVPY